jgi:hypothetical protein
MISSNYIYYTHYNEYMFQQSEINSKGTILRFINNEISARLRNAAEII